MMRLIGFGRVERVECARKPGGRFRPRAAPVSMVSKSRISPTRITSGSCRRALRSACANDRVSTADFALIDHRFAVAVQELDRVLDRHHVAPRASG